MSRVRPAAGARPRPKGALRHRPTSRPRRLRSAYVKAGLGPGAGSGAAWERLIHQEPAKAKAAPGPAAAAAAAARASERSSAAAAAGAPGPPSARAAAAAAAGARRREQERAEDNGGAECPSRAAGTERAARGGGGRGRGRRRRGGGEGAARPSPVSDPRPGLAPGADARPASACPRSSPALGCLHFLGWRRRRAPLARPPRSARLGPAWAPRGAFPSLPPPAQRPAACGPVSGSPVLPCHPSAVVWQGWRVGASAAGVGWAGRCGPGQLSLPPHTGSGHLAPGPW